MASVLTEALVKNGMDVTLFATGDSVGPALRNELLGNALALLHPINFQEPFGLSVAEAVMCGTPVIAFNMGSMQELIITRKTGFIVQNVQDTVLALDHIRLINRKVCREHAMDKFCSNVMARHYMQLYKKVARQRSGL